MGFSDIFMPKQSGALDGFQLDPALKQYLAQQRTREFFDRIGQIGQGMIAASSRGASFGNALAEGVANAGGYGRGRGPGRGGFGLLDALDMQTRLDKVRSRRKKQRKETEYQDLISGGSGLGPDGIDWNAPRPGNPDLTKGMSPAQRGLLSSLSREQGLGILKKREFPGPVEYNAPTAVEGPNGKPMLVRFPTRLGEPVPVAGYRPHSKSAKPTMSTRKLALLNRWRAAQEGRAEWGDTDQAEWDMIIQADPMDILRRNMLRGMGRDPAASNASPDSATPPPSGASAEEPGFWADPYGYFFGSGAEAGQPTPGGNGSAPSVQSPAREIDGPTRPIPRDAQGRPDASRLVAGQVYERHDGTRWRWDGQNFSETQ